ncbi:microtubule associated protein-domain-containing protein [Cryomyces antarcticus]
MDTSYLSQQVTTIINQLHGFFDEIGVPSHERDSRESELFSALSETLHNQLRLVATEKHNLTEEAQRLARTIRQMEASLDDSKSNSNYDLEDEELKVTFPLLTCLQSLKEKYNTVSKLHRERFEQVKKLVQALESYASHLEPSFVQIELPPTSPNAKISPSFDLSPSYVTSLDNEFTRVYEEYTRRVATVKALAEEIVHLWGELGTPQAQIDSSIVECLPDAPEQLGLHQDDLSRLRARREKLFEERRGRERRLKELRTTVEGLWDRLGIEELERRKFLANNRGWGLRAINEFEDELSRLNELKRQNLHLFVEDARCKIQELWDGLYFSEEEMLEFTPAFSDVYSDALLSAHEAEIARLEALREQRAPTLQLIDKHRSLIKDRDDLAASSQDASRLMARGQKGEKRDPTRLLREEKMRKRIAKELPKVETEVKRILESWEDEYGRPFLVHGQRYLDELVASTAKAAPPRSKTPSGPAPSMRKDMLRSAPQAQRAGTLRGAPPPSSKTPTSLDQTGRNPFAASMLGSSISVSSTNTGTGTGSLRSPSRIPARAPLGDMPHGNNSPERRARAEKAAADANNENGTATLRARVGMGPPRAPPPKMKDLFVPPPIATRSPSPHDEYDGLRSASVVRHVPPEDVYDDRERMLPPSHYSQYQHSQPQRQQHEPLHQHQQPTRPHHPYTQLLHAASSTTSAAESRQISASSTASAASASVAASGSENWETYTDASDSEPEVDARAAYYARLMLRQQQAAGGDVVSGGGGGGGGKLEMGLAPGKRDAPSPFKEAPGAGKRVKGGVAGGIRGVPAPETSEAGWSDEGDAF